MKHYLNVCDINGAEVEPVDIITFGSPCQDLSIAGKRKGLMHESKGDETTTRSGLFYEAIRIIKEMRAKTNGKYPKYAIYENVPGAFSSNKGWDFHAVLEALCSVCDSSVSIPKPYDAKRTDRLVWLGAGEIVGNGYSVAWRTLDAQYWGVPQRRKRIYLVADFTGQRAGEILFKQNCGTWHSSEGGKAREGAAADAVGGVDGSTGDRCIAVDGYNQSVNDTFGAIRSAASDQDHVGCVVYALQGNGIDRSDTAGCNGCGWREGEMYTLNTIDRPAVVYPDVAKTLEARFDSSPCIDRGQNVVCYGARGNGDGETVNMLTGDHNDRVTDYTVLAVQERKSDSNVNATKNHARKILPILWEEVRKEAAAEWGFGILNPLQPQNVLQSGVHGERISQQEKQRDELGGRSQSGTEISFEGTMRSVWEEKRDGCSPQRRKLSEQRSKQFNENMQELSQQDTYEQAELCNMRKTGEGAGILRQALSEIQEIRKPDDGKNKSICRRYIVRRLTPIEAARLQGFPDDWGELAPYNPADADFWESVRKTHAEINGKKYKPTKSLKRWYDSLHTDSAEYKMWGNGIALPCAEYVLHGLSKQGAKTLGSLFDGSGGFPLAGSLNGISPLWSSEIEPYPIAVTVSRFRNDLKEQPQND